MSRTKESPKNVRGRTQADADRAALARLFHKLATLRGRAEEVSRLCDAVRGLVPRLPAGLQERFWDIDSFAQGLDNEAGCVIGEVDRLAACPDLGALVTRLTAPPGGPGAARLGEAYGRL